MKDISKHIPVISLIILPIDIFAGFRAIVCNFIFSGLRFFSVFASGQFIPFVIRFSVAVYILRYEYDARFCTPS